MTKHEEPLPVAEIEDTVEHEENGEEIDGFDEGCDAASFDLNFDPMQALGQLLVTQDGETIPDVLVGIRQSLDTLTKVLHKLAKAQEQK